MSLPVPSIDKLCIDTVRCLSMDAVQKANSGHPGTPMAQAPAAYALWTRFLKHNPANPSWPDRDRFILSCGHASMLIYSLLYLTGYGLELEDLKQFRQWDSKTPGHPEFGHTAGIETTTGPLGQGIGNAVGMAIAERWLAARFNRPDHDIVNHHTFVFAGDGCLMEGIAMEAASLAGHLALEKLIVLWDNNRITIEGSTDLAFTEDVAKRFEGQGWRVLKIQDGENLAEIERVYSDALQPCGKPTLIDCTTIIGFPAPTKQNTHHAHGAPLGDGEIRATKTILGFDPEQTFQVPAEALSHWRNCQARGAAQEAEWQTRFNAYKAAFPELAAEYEAFLSGQLPAGWDTALPVFETKDSYATREASGKTLNVLASRIPNLVGGSADLAPSNNTAIPGGEFTATESGNTFHWGIREHAMGAALNGMSLHGGLRTFGATFLIFCDYMRPAIRLAALMKQPVTYVLTHDSIGVGEDGPTHQPIEQIMSMRMIPGLTVIRPADANETVVAWQEAMKAQGPVVLALTRQKLPTLDAAVAANAAKGGYVLVDAADAKVAIVATGSEVQLAVKAAAQLANEGIAARVVSLPSWELFAKQDAAYRASVLPKNLPTVSVEAGTTFGWQRFADVSVGIDHFGASAPADILFEKFGVTTEAVVKAAKGLLA